MARAPQRSWLWALRVALCALILPLASAGALPSWVAMLVPEAHVCHCSVERHECFCVKCHPDRTELAVSEESISGRCGDDETPYGAGKLLAVVPAAFSVVPAVLHTPVAFGVGIWSVPESVFVPPPTPPPESAS